MDSEVMIVLSAYNGARFIREQIESIRAQTFRDWTLLIRDDGSSDDTVPIIRELANHDARISLLGDSSGNVGAWRSFGLLLSAARQDGAKYVFFSDQDDVWLQQKMSTQLNALRAVEKSSPSTPVLVHSDLLVVDDRLSPIHPSFREFQHAAYEASDPLGTLLVHNTVVGCTIAINQPLMELADPLPPDAPHDWWLSLCAASAGRIVSLEEPMVQYRQHSSNAIGAQARRASRMRLARTPLRTVIAVFKGIAESVSLATALEQRLMERNATATVARARVRQYRAAFATLSPILRLRALKKSGARPTRRLSRALFPPIVALMPRYANGSR